MTIKKLLMIFLTLSLILSLSAVAYAEGDNSESETQTTVAESTTLEDSSVSEGSSESVSEPLTGLSDFQVIEFLISIIIGILVGQSFSFWKW